MAGPFDDLIPPQNRQQPTPAQDGPRLLYQAPRSPTTVLNERKIQADIDRLPVRDALDRSQLDEASRKPKQQAFDNAGKLADDFRMEIPVKSYRGAIASYGNALNTPATPEGDLSLIYSYAKIMDPDSVVREGEAASVANSSPYAQQMVARLQKELGAGGLFTAGARQRLRDALHTRMAELNRSYIQARVAYKQRADRAGIDPMDVVGNHEGEAFRGVEGRFLGHEPSQADYQGNVIAPTPPEYKSVLDGGSPLPPDQPGLRVDVTDFGPPLPGETEDQWLARTERLQQEKIAAEQAAMNAERDAQPVDTFVRSAANTVTLGLADKLAAVVNTVSDGGTYADNLAREKAITATDQRVNPVANVTGTLAGGLLLPTLGARSAAQFAALGGGYGGAYAYNTDQDPLTGALTGAAGGYVGSKIVEPLSAMVARIGSGRAAPAADRVATMDAANRQGIDLLPADVAGPVTRGATAAARQGIVSEYPIAGALARTVQQASQARGRAADMVGESIDPIDAGELVRKAANIYSTRTSEIGGKLYDRARARAGDIKIPLGNARQVIDQHIGELEQTPGGGALLEEMKRLRDAIGGGEFPIDGIRAMRSRLREEADFRGLRGSDTDRRLREVSDAASQDIVDTLRANGNEAAAAAYATADRFWKQRVETIDQVLDPLLGKNSPRSGEQIFSSLERMANKQGGDYVKLRRLMAAMPKDEAASVRATVIQRLGEASAGRQNADGNVFSFGEFLTRWNSMSDKAKSVLFQGEARAALDDLAKVASGAKATAAYANASNTTRATFGQALLTGGATGVTGAGSLLAIIPAQYITGRVLASPNFARWLARAPKTANPKAQAAYATKLNSIAAREPAVSAEIIQIADYLREAASRSPGRAAASGEEEDARQKPPQ